MLVGHIALGPFGHVSLFGAGSLLNYISLFGPLGHVSLFGARSPHREHNFVIKSLHGTFTETSRDVTKFFPTAEQVGWRQPCGW